MKVSARSTVLVLFSTLALGCGGHSGSKRPAQATPAVLDASSSEQASFAVAAATAAPDDLNAWGAVRRDADGSVAIEGDDGVTYAVANPAELDGLADGAPLSFQATPLPAMSADGAPTIALKRVVPGGPLLVSRADADLDDAKPAAALAAASAPAPVAATLVAPAPASLALAAAQPVMLASAAPAAAAPAPAAAGPAPAAPASATTTPWALRHGMTSAGYQDQVQDLAGKGFRVVSIGAHGSKDDPRFTAIWVKDGKPWAARHALTSDQLQDSVQDFAAQGFRPVTVAQYGIWPSERYAVAYVKDGAAWEMRHRMSSASYQERFEEMGKAGLRPLWVTSTGLLGSERYAAIWIKDGKGTIARHRLTKGELEDALFANDNKGWRLACLSEHGTPGAYRYAALWERDAAPGAVTNLVFLRQTGSTYQTIANHLAGDGFRPTCVIQTGAAASPRFCHTWRRDPGAWTFQKTGFAQDAVRSLDAAVESYMRDRRVTHLTLCVAKDGQVVLSRGYTYGPASTRVTQPGHRMRIASISKPMTAVAVMRLVEQGKLSLDDTVGEHLDTLTKNPKDARFRQVTIRQLLQHRGGWAIKERRDDEDKLVHAGLGFDPMFHDKTIGLALLEPLAIEPTDVIRYMAQRKTLQFAPGAYYSYSNFGFNILGRIIEKVTGKGYEDYVRQTVFQPVGASSFRVGHARLHQRLPGEVFYNDAGGALSTDKHGTGEVLPNQYGGWNLHNMDSHGGWVCTARDLVRVTNAVQSGQLLGASARTEMWTKQSDTNYGLGWSLSGGTLPSHNGSLPGTSTELRVRPQGVVYAVLTNQRTAGDDPMFAWAKQGSSIASRLDNALKAIYGP